MLDFGDSRHQDWLQDPPNQRGDDEFVTGSVVVHRSVRKISQSSPGRIDFCAVCVCICIACARAVPHT
jgi:hypothetical protein